MAESSKTLPTNLAQQNQWDHSKWYLLHLSIGGKSKNELTCAMALVDDCHFFLVDRGIQWENQAQQLQ